MVWGQAWKRGSDFSMEGHTKIEKKSEIHSEIEFQNKEHVPFPFEFRKLIAVGLFELSPSLCFPPTKY